MLAPASVAADPSVRRPRVRWASELGLLALLYVGYAAARAAITVHADSAHERGHHILRLETIVHLDIEQPLNAFVVAVPALGLVFAYLYATLHYMVTPGVMLWIAVRRADGYRSARNGLLAATVLGLICYWLLPTAPPRLFDSGFIDVMAVHSGIGWWGEAASAPRGMEGLSNQYAAFPSLHVGWAMWVTLSLRDNVGSSAVRRWAWGYPALMCVVVMATANHFLLDAVAGIACVYAGRWLTGRLAR